MLISQKRYNIERAYKLSYNHCADNEFQLSTTLLLKTNYLLCKRNLLLNSFFLWPLRPPSSKSKNKPLSIIPLSVLYVSTKSLLILPLCNLVKPNNFNLSSHFQFSIPWTNFVALLWTPYISLIFFGRVWIPHLDAVFQMWSDETFIRS